MATDSADPATLMNIPLELRHLIFEHAAGDGRKPKKLFRHWFEKKEVKEQIAQAISDNPTGPTPVAYYPPDHDPDTDLEEEGDEDDREVLNSDDEDFDADDGDDDDDDDDEGIDHEEDEFDEDVEDEDVEDEDVEDEDVEDEDEENGDADEIDQNGMNANGNLVYPDFLVPHVQNTLASSGINTNQDGVAIQNGDGSDDPALYEEDDEATYNDHTVVTGPINSVGYQHDSDGAEDDEQEDQDTATDTYYDASTGVDAAAAQAASAPPPPVPAPRVSPHHKWVHIPKFIRISHCPPPLELLLTSKDLSKEAMDWFYNVAVLRIDATGSFAHTSMFEESLNQIADAAFSPMENVRKVEVLFSWDTEWLRGTEGVMPEPFEAMLRLRAMHVVTILHRAPNLKEVVIHWYDSVLDNESTILKLDILDSFDSISANIKVEEHFLEPGKKPLRRSIQGQRRLEFKAILDSGMILN